MDENKYDTEKVKYTSLSNSLKEKYAADQDTVSTLVEMDESLKMIISIEKNLWERQEQEITEQLALINEKDEKLILSDQQIDQVLRVMEEDHEALKVKFSTKDGAIVQKQYNQFVKAVPFLEPEVAKRKQEQIFFDRQKHSLDQIESTLNNLKRKLKQKQQDYNKILKEVPLLINEIAAMEKLRTKRERNNRKKIEIKNETREIKRQEQQLAERRRQLRVDQQTKNAITYFESKDNDDIDSDNGN